MARQGRASPPSRALVCHTRRRQPGIGFKNVPILFLPRTFGPVGAKRRDPDLPRRAFGETLLRHNPANDGALRREGDKPRVPGSFHTLGAVLPRLRLSGGRRLEQRLILSFGGGGLCIHGTRYRLERRYETG